MRPFDLFATAAKIDAWVQPVIGLRKVLLFGSRVRGDYRPDSDLDFAIDLQEDIDIEGDFVSWWLQVNEDNFADLRRIVAPVSVSIHRSDDRGEEWKAIRPAKLHPALVVGKCFCLHTPRRSAAG